MSTKLSLSLLGGLLSLVALVGAVISAAMLIEKWMPAEPSTAQECTEQCDGVCVTFRNTRFNQEYWARRVVRTVRASVYRLPVTPSGTSAVLGNRSRRDLV